MWWRSKQKRRRIWRFISFSFHFKKMDKKYHIKICLRRVHILIFKSSNFIRSTMQKTARTKRLLITIYEIEFPRQVILSYDQSQKKNAQIPVNQWSRQCAHPQKWIRFQGMNIFRSISCQYLMLWSFSSEDKVKVHYIFVCARML